jgi:hypothetical protein
MAFNLCTHPFSHGDTLIVRASSNAICSTVGTSDP